MKSLVRDTNKQRSFSLSLVGKQEERIKVSIDIKLGINLGEARKTREWSFIVQDELVIICL